MQDGNLDYYYVSAERETETSHGSVRAAAGLGLLSLASFLFTG